jgi:CRISPR-associated protein Csh2
MKTIQNNSDFLFLYEAINCNPNGDPDQENKPRMDYDTQTNLVTDTRVKRYIRDYFIQNGKDVFVSMEDDAKVSVESKLKAVVERTIEKEEELNKAFSDNEEALKIYQKIVEDKKDADAVWKEITKKKFKHKEVNYELLAYLVKEKFIDIRLFGSAFAVGGFTRAYTGPVQLNWGYSLNDVYLIDSDSIVTIMNDDSSTFGKDYRVHYSLLGFHGVANKHSAKSTGLSDSDMEEFREAIWHAIPSLPTRSKLNQYPKLYLEIVYNDGYHNGYFGDLRDYVDCTAKEEFKKVRKYNDLNVDFSQLEKIISENKGEGKIIKEVKVKTAHGITLNF